MLGYLDPSALGVIVAAAAFLFVMLLTAVLGIRFSIGQARLPAAVRWSELDQLVGAREEQLRDLEERVHKREAALAERDQMEAEAEHWRSVVETLKAEYAGLASQRQEIEQVREDFRQAAEELGVKETELRALRSDIEEAQINLREIAERRDEAERRISDISDVKAELDEAAGELTRLREEKAENAAEIQRQRDRLASFREEQENLQQLIWRQKEEYDGVTAALQSARDALEEIAPARAEVEQLREERVTIRRELDEISAQKDLLIARLARLKEDVAEHAGDSPSETDATVLQDMYTVPACLAREDGESLKPVWPQQSDIADELEALHRVSQLLEDNGLDFSRRMLYAFHTSLKTAIISPLTVLAGISGTGKSLLPRRYAEAMGIHFLKIPVQPRWDSPQDLFGFYNYIEKRYKATELARALVHLDPYNWPEQAEPYRDRMLLVLLDEMNLARVEYYFSEFLSRLEGRPPDADAAKGSERAPAEIDIDISRKGQAKRVYAGQNVLFVGTMNEDESTLALSDKVLDRANVLRFPRPAHLKEGLPVPKEEHRAEGYMPKTRWSRNWTKTADGLEPAIKRQATDVLQDINDIMDAVGRPFGHRMSQSMLHYVANYPAAQHQTNNMGQLHHGLADQIEQRIMPKLRGLDISDHASNLQRLGQLAGEKLQDPDLADAIEKALQHSRSLGVFNWRGFSRLRA